MKADPKSTVYFTKHLFRTGVTCPTKLYYKAHNYPENRQAVPFIRHAVFNKRLLKTLARTSFHNGQFMKAGAVAIVAEQTMQQLSSKEAVVFDSVFKTERMMARLPIIHRENKDLTVYHIQTKAFDPRRHSLLNHQEQIHSKWRTYLLEFAYQLFLVKQNLPQLSLHPVLVLPNKAGKSVTDYLPLLLTEYKQNPCAAGLPETNRQLLVQLDVEEIISQIWKDPHFADQFLPKASFEDSLIYLRDLFFSKAKYPSPVDMRCKSCEFRLESKRAMAGTRSGFTECWSPFTKADNASCRHVFDLIGPGTDKWVQKQIYDQRNVPEEDLPEWELAVNGKGRISQKMRQTLQVNKVKGRTVPDEIIRRELFEELKRWKYPLHFLDFEAGNYALPVRSGRKPYHLVVFQFSCHTLYKDGSWKHYQWMDDLNSGYSNYELIRQLKGLPEIDKGTIIQYSNFERNALKVIRRELMNEQEQVEDANELIAWIERIIQRRDSSHQHPPYVADLSRQVKNFYYNRKMESSLSIKEVLHSVMKMSSPLKNLYARPYYSTNFDGIVWWQKGAGGKLRNPYQLLEEYQANQPEQRGEAVQRGTQAMVAYGHLMSGQINAGEEERVRKALYRYCELDTLAMLMIYQHWQNESEALAQTS